MYDCIVIAIIIKLKLHNTKRNQKAEKAKC